MSKRTRFATHDIHDGPQQRVCMCCHKLPKFCKCSSDVKPTCPICGDVYGAKLHYPNVDCRALKRSASSITSKV